MCLKSISVDKNSSRHRIQYFGRFFCGIRNPKKDLEEQTWSQICMQFFWKSGSLSTLIFGRLVNLRSCWFQLRLHFMYYKCIISDREMVFLWCSMGAGSALDCPGMDLCGLHLRICMFYVWYIVPTFDVWAMPCRLDTQILVVGCSFFKMLNSTNR